MNHTDIQAFVRSHTFVKILAILGALIIALFIFEAGIVVGFHKASFAYHWQENYERNFGPTGGAFMPGRGAPNPHGTTGKIVSVSLPTFVVAGSGENERTVQIMDNTIIRDGGAVVTSSDVTSGKYVTVLGAPDDEGVVEAGFIRIMPQPSATSTATSSTSR